MSPLPPQRTGTLVLVPNTLDLGTDHEGDLRDVLPQAVIERAAVLGFWVAENAKTTRALLKRVSQWVPLALPLQQIQIQELPRPAKGGAAPARATSAPADLRPLLAPALAGHDVGLLSEAGLPAVADPGALLVAAAHEAGIAVQPLAGPSSITLALAASGLHGQCFAFQGYLPTDPASRAARLRELESRSAREQQTQIVIETPYRNAALAAALLETLRPETRLSIAHGLTLPGGWCRTRAVRGWRAQLPAFGDRPLPAVFLWLAT